eukprot:3107334-Pyramimonas_sp.AAC.1
MRQVHCPHGIAPKSCSGLGGRNISRRFQVVSSLPGLGGLSRIALVHCLAVSPVARRIVVLAAGGRVRLVDLGAGMLRHLPFSFLQAR